jgi:protoheme IX farnesyltransferase
VKVLGERRASPAGRERSGVAPRRRSGVLRAYAGLTKPRIVTLLLITTVPSMILAERGFPSLWLVVATLIGGTVAAGGANAINQYVDRDIDEVMTRTRRRPLPSRRIQPRNALVFGLALGASAFVWLLLTVNFLSAVLALSAFGFYVLVYSLWLKRSSPQNIVIGGAAGAVPVLVGWAAVTGRIGLPAVALFVIVFLWTPPHFWALSLRYERDYRAAGIPMLPVVAGRVVTTKRIVAYSVLLVVASLALYPVGHTGLLYPAGALVLGAPFILKALHLRRTVTTSAAMSLFRYSILYLALLFLVLAIDTLVRFGL